MPAPLPGGTAILTTVTPTPGVPETAGPRSFPAGRPGGVVAGVGTLELDDGRSDLWEESASSGGNKEERSLCAEYYQTGDGPSDRSV
ncbi:hypothetical protein MRX96_005187 [Rhipicephalus microplus]